MINETCRKAPLLHLFAYQISICSCHAQNRVKISNVGDVCMRLSAAERKIAGRVSMLSVSLLLLSPSHVGDANYLCRDGRGLVQDAVDDCSDAQASPLTADPYSVKPAQIVVTYNTE